MGWLYKVMGGADKEWVAEHHCRQNGGGANEVMGGAKSG